jgi:hypothetical protein
MLVRLAMMIWSASQFYSASPTGMSSLYFRQGYAISAGLGFVLGNADADDWLNDLQRKVADEGFVATPATIGPVPAGLYADTLHPPGMSLLVASVHRLTGAPADRGMQFLGAVLDSLAAVLVAWIGMAISGPRVGAIGGMLYALFLPQAWAATGAQMPDGLVGVFIIATMAAYMMALKSDGLRRYTWFAVAGVMLGLGSYLRPDYLLAPIAMLPFLWLHLRRLGAAAIGSTVVMVTALLVLSPWAYRNHVEYGRWIFTSSGAGATMVTGLGQFDNPWGFGPSDNDRHAEARAQGFPNAWVPEADDYFRRVWLDAVAAKPGAFIGSMLKKVPIAVAPPFEFGFVNPLKTRTFSAVRAATGGDRYDAIASQPLYVLGAYWESLLMAAFSAIALAASAFWLISERSQRTLILLLLSLHGYSMATHVIVHIEPRFLLPSMFTLLLGLAFLIARLKAERR